MHFINIFGPVLEYEHYVQWVGVSYVLEFFTVLIFNTRNSHKLCSITKTQDTYQH